MPEAYRVVIGQSDAKGKKMQAVFYDRDGKKLRTVQFGATGYSDFTKHKDTERRDRYDARHSNEDWSDPMKAGTLAKFVLWNKPSLEASIKDYRRRFGLKG